MQFIVELEEGVFLAPWAGDPGRTLHKNRARFFASEVAANRHLAKARKFKPFENARVLKIQKRIHDKADVRAWF